MRRRQDGTTIWNSGAVVFLLQCRNHIPKDHLLRDINHFLGLGDFRQQLAEYYILDVAASAINKTAKVEATRTMIALVE